MSEEEFTQCVQIIRQQIEALHKYIIQTVQLYCCLSVLDMKSWDFSLLGLAHSDHSMMINKGFLIWLQDKCQRRSLMPAPMN